MPVKYCPHNGKWRIGDGTCMYHTKEDAEKAYAGYRGSKFSKRIQQLKEQIWCVWRV